MGEFKRRRISIYWSGTYDGMKRTWKVLDIYPLQLAVRNMDLHYAYFAI